MYDQSINTKSLYNTLRRSDFHRVFDLRDEKLRAAILNQSVAVGNKNGWEISPIKKSLLRGKSIYALPDFHNELLIRKVNNNIRHFERVRNPARASIVTNLALIIAEAVPYRIYRLDVKSFFESFSVAHVLKTIDDINLLSLATKRILRDLFKHFVASGGTGIPRGLAISSTLSELMMSDFDTKIKNMSNVFFYSRYVDDIIIITGSAELEQNFIRQVASALPEGLRLSRDKQKITTVKKATTTGKLKFSFEYLGYKFNVKDPELPKSCRQVNLGISEGKLKKIKTKVVLSLKDFCKTKNMEVLLARINFLCGNFAINDRDRGKKRLAGIFYNYHLIKSTESFSGLKELDLFLLNAITSGQGPVFSEFKCSTTNADRRRLASFSFSHGFHNKVFTHYTGKKLKQIQECWKYA